MFLAPAQLVFFNPNYQPSALIRITSAYLGITKHNSELLKLSLAQTSACSSSVNYNWPSLNVYIAPLKTLTLNILSVAV